MADGGNAELLALAKSFNEVDLYALLGVAPDASSDNIHRAWRRAALKNHPDKAGPSFDAIKYERLEQARNVLCDDAARRAYDSARAVKVRRAEERNAMDAKTRRFAEELERAERAAEEEQRRKDNPGKRKYGDQTDAEVEARRAAGKRMMAERKKAKAEREQRWEQERREREAAERAAKGEADVREEEQEQPKVAEPEDSRTIDERLADTQRRIMEKLREKRLRKAAQGQDPKAEPTEPPSTTA
jgi:DnaJ homolog subfamily C member 17